jgi:ubiquinone/menaquinone biosynthesis C-methylase UbiE
MKTGIKYHSLLNKLAKTMVLNPVHGIGVGVLRGVGAIDFPVPPNSSMRKTSATNVVDYYVSGIRCYLPIATMAEQAGLDLRAGGLNILDFGCGVGRQLLHFTRTYPANRYYACDVDNTAVAFIAKSYSQVTSYVNNFSPPLSYADGQFDLIYSVSIFSHLNMEDQKVWLTELARVTRPGGCLCLTTEGYTALKWLSATFGTPEAEAAAALRNQGWLYREYDDWREAARKSSTLPIASGLVGIHNSYGNTALSPEYIRQNWSISGLTVTDVIEGVIDDRQDLVVLRRNG